MRELVDRINRHSLEYYVYDNPTISDAQWDELYDQLLHMEKESGAILPDSPSRRVGGDTLQAFKQHRHLSRLWSLDKVKSAEEMNQWFARASALQIKEGLPPLKFAVEYKYDGLTINLTYQQGMLTTAATRGNGRVGEEILAQAITVRGIPLSIPYQGLLEIHGECIMKLSDFNNYNKTAQEPLKNARNAAAGAIRNLDPQVTASRRLSAFFYEIGTIENPPYSSQEAMLSFIRENGFPTTPLLTVTEDVSKVFEAIEKIEKERENLNFLIDGAVIKITDKHTRSVFGYTDKFPRWAIAYKFAAEESITTLESVTWDPGRTGKLTPLGHVSPVEFSGVTVRRATLNNWGDIQRKGLFLGAQVWIRRSNDVIPEIMGIVNYEESGIALAKPIFCPACETKLVEIGANLFCPNRDGCKPQVVARLSHFAARDAMDIEGFSQKTAELFFDLLNIREPDALYKISKTQLLDLPGFLDKKADNLLQAIEASKNCQLDAFIFAIGIPNVGRGTARDIGTHFGSLDAIRQANLQTLEEVDGVGTILAQSITDYFSDECNNRLVDALIEVGVNPHNMAVAGDRQIFEGQSIVVTGTLPNLSRAEAENLIRSHGGIAASSVSRKTSFLVCGEKAGSKLIKARGLGITILDEAALLEMIK
ncbi:MAG: NAD-dependent DNA ligase LigA [Clostridiales bacterium]|nr:NAD-dependent DNA ligase LigA [Clostridiales bacterium]